MKMMEMENGRSEKKKGRGEGFEEKVKRNIKKRKIKRKKRIEKLVGWEKRKIEKRLKKIINVDELIEEGIEKEFLKIEESRKKVEEKDGEKKMERIKSDMNIKIGKNIVDKEVYEERIIGIEGKGNEWWRIIKGDEKEWKIFEIEWLNKNEGLMRGIRWKKFKGIGKIIMEERVIDKDKELKEENGNSEGLVGKFWRIGIDIIGINEDKGKGIVEWKIDWWGIKEWEIIKKKIVGKVEKKERKWNCRKRKKDVELVWFFMRN